MNRQFFICALLSSFLISSCSNHSSVTKRKYRPGFFVQVFSTDKSINQNISFNAGKVAALESPFAEVGFDSSGSSAGVGDENVAVCKIDSSVSSKVVRSIPSDGDTVRILELNETIGSEIDSTEKADYGLFPFWKDDEFVSAHFEQQKDGQIVLVGKFKNGIKQSRLISKQKYKKLQESLVNEGSAQNAVSPEERIRMLDKVDAEAAERAGRRSLRLVVLPIISLIVYLFVLYIIGAISGDLLIFLVPELLLVVFLILGVRQAILAMRRSRVVKKRHRNEPADELRRQAKHGRNMGILSLVLGIPFLAAILALIIAQL